MDLETQINKKLKKLFEEEEVEAQAPAESLAETEDQAVDQAPIESLAETEDQAVDQAPIESLAETVDQAVDQAPIESLAATEDQVESQTENQENEDTIKSQELMNKLKSIAAAIAVKVYTDSTPNRPLDIPISPDTVATNNDMISVATAAIVAKQRSDSQPAATEPNVPGTEPVVPGTTEPVIPGTTEPVIPGTNEPIVPGPSTLTREQCDNEINQLKTRLTQVRDDIQCDINTRKEMKSLESRIAQNFNELYKLVTETLKQNAEYYNGLNQASVVSDQTRKIDITMRNMEAIHSTINTLKQSVMSNSANAQQMANALAQLPVLQTQLADVVDKLNKSPSGSVSADLIGQVDEIITTAMLQENDEYLKIIEDQRKFMEKIAAELPDAVAEGINTELTAKLNAQTQSIKDLMKIQEKCLGKTEAVAQGQSASIAQLDEKLDKLSTEVGRISPGELKSTLNDLAQKLAQIKNTQSGTGSTSGTSSASTVDLPSAKSAVATSAGINETDLTHFATTNGNTYFFVDNTTRKIYKYPK